MDRTEETPTCPECGSEDVTYDEMPSMAGHGHDSSFTCRACGLTETSHPDVS